RPNLIVAMGATAAQAIFGPGFESLGNAARSCPPSLRQGYSRLFIHHRFFANPTRSRANVNTSISSPICALQYAPLAKNELGHSTIVASRVLYPATNAFRN